MANINILSSIQDQRQRGTLIGNIFGVDYGYKNIADAHRAQGIAVMVAGTMLAALAGMPLLLVDASDYPLFTILGYGVGLPQISYGLMVLATILGFFITRYLLNSGRLEAAGSAFVATLFIMVTIVHLPNEFAGASLLAFSMPIVAAGVILGPRGLLVSSVVFLAVFTLTYLVQVHWLPEVAGGQMADAQVLGFGILITLVNVIILNTFSVGQRILLEHNLELTDELRKSEAELEERVKVRTIELEQARDEAERANRIKSQFLASMSHELRTPLNAILSFNELMAGGTFGPVNDEQVSYLSKSLHSGRHLLSLINDVLDVTKIQAGMLSLFIEESFNLRHEMETIATSAENMLAGKPVRLVRDIDDDLPLLTCDKRRIRQVLLNLVSNAVKFTEAGTITLSAKRRGDEVLLAVIDTGPGISTEEQGIIFEPFIQSETGVRHAGGTGLGLPISRSLVDAHGGRLWLESTIGEGSAFYVLLPAVANERTASHV